MNAQKKIESPINDELMSRATRCTAPLRELSDAGKEVWPIHIGQVQDLIVKELADIHLNGLKSTKGDTDEAT